MTSTNDDIKLAEGFTIDELAKLFDAFTTSELSEDCTDQELAENVAEIVRRQNSGAKLTNADVEVLRARAQEIVTKNRAAIGETKGGAVKAQLVGMDEIHNFPLSIGLPAPRTLFGQMVEASTATATQKKAWHRQLEGMSEITEIGSIRVDFFDIGTQKKDTAYLVLGECEENHDLGAQLDKIFPRIPREKHDEIRRHLSILIHLGRWAYGQMMVKMMPVLDEIREKIPAQGDDKPFDPRILGVDPTNTTFYIMLPGTRRTGIFVRLADEIADEIEISATGTPPAADTTLPANTPSDSASEIGDDK